MRYAGTLALAGAVRATFSTAMVNRSGERWAYRKTISRSACPIKSRTVLRSMPDCTRRLAK